MRGDEVLTSPVEVSLWCSLRVVIELVKCLVRLVERECREHGLDAARSRTLTLMNETKKRPPCTPPTRHFRPCDSQPKTRRRVFVWAASPWAKGLDQFCVWGGVQGSEEVTEEPV